MGKPIMSQRRGKGSPSFTAPSHRFKAVAKYRSSSNELHRFEVIDLVDDPGRSCLLMLMKYDDGTEWMLPAPENIAVGDVLEEGANARVDIGNILPLDRIPEGFPIFNVETRLGDGGAFARGSGNCAFLVSKSNRQALVKMPSGALKYLDLRCRATIGVACGGGRLEKPMLKASVGRYRALARGHWYPTVRGVHMSPYDHPFGGKQHHGAITPKRYGAPAGVHVGSFGSRRTGRKKR